MEKKDEFKVFTNGKFNDEDYMSIAYSLRVGGFTTKEAREWYGEELMGFYRKFKTNEWEGDLV